MFCLGSWAPSTLTRHPQNVSRDLARFGVPVVATLTARKPDRAMRLRFDLALCASTARAHQTSANDAELARGVLARHTRPRAVRACRDVPRRSNRRWSVRRFPSDAILRSTTANQNGGFSRIDDHSTLRPNAGA
jgi:hypothetical protein